MKRERNRVFGDDFIIRTNEVGFDLDLAILERARQSGTAQDMIPGVIEQGGSRLKNGANDLPAQKVSSHCAAEAISF